MSDKAREFRDWYFNIELSNIANPTEEGCMQAYADQEVKDKLESVSEEDIENRFPDKITNTETGNLIKSPIGASRQYGAKWLLNHLKNR